MIFICGVNIAEKKITRLKKNSSKFGVVKSTRNIETPPGVKNKITPAYTNPSPRKASAHNKTSFFQENSKRTILFGLTAIFGLALSRSHFICQQVGIGNDILAREAGKNPIQGKKSKKQIFLQETRNILGPTHWGWRYQSKKNPSVLSINKQKIAINQNSKNISGKPEDLQNPSIFLQKKGEFYRISLKKRLIQKLRKLIFRFYKVEQYLKRQVKEQLEQLAFIGCYRSLRHAKKLPCRGQRTHTNAQTAKKPWGMLVGFFPGPITHRK